ncbi:MAG TPA: hypothetical protein VGD60_04990 [Candidatus Acidoferrales bacterium]
MGGAAEVGGGAGSFGRGGPRVESGGKPPHSKMGWAGFDRGRFAIEVKCGRRASRLFATSLVVLFLSFFPAVTKAQNEKAGKSAAAAAAPAPAAGLAVGQRAPDFAGVDQFGHEVSNETLRGAHGTIILFFRSADW